MPAKRNRYSVRRQYFELNFATAPVQTWFCEDHTRCKPPELRRKLWLRRLPQLLQRTFQQRRELVRARHRESSNQTVCLRDRFRTHLRNPRLRARADQQDLSLRTIGLSRATRNTTLVV
jgi:hypothetical protein